MLLSVSVTVRLLRAGRGQPSVSAKRMRILAFAAATLTIALLGTTFATDQSKPGALVVQLIGFVAIAGFYLGIDPPRIVRAYWRTPEQARLQEAMRGLVRLAVSRSEIAARIAAPAAALVGARGLAVRDAEGNELAAWGTVEPDGGVVIEEDGLMFVAWTSPYAPFFGQDELRALHTIVGLTATALDRVRLFEQEHETRLALERANELMTNFVALAAHELRTPVTTIHGFVQTLNHLGSRLSEAQKARAARSARAADASHGRAGRAASRPLAARCGRGRRAAAGRRARVASPTGRRGRRRRAHADEIEVDVPENASAHRRSARSSTTSSRTSSRTRSATGVRRSG